MTPAIDAPVSNRPSVVKRWPPAFLTPGRIDAALVILILALFFVFGKAAYQSYFSDDDLDNMPLARYVPWLDIPKSIFSLTYINNVRPLGILYYKIMGAAAHYNFAAYVAVLQAFHVATSLALWLFLRRLGMRPFAAAVGCLFFTLNAASLPAYWKPMYVFDVLCGFWVILSLLLYQRGKLVPSFLCAWLAFRSKEMELMLPILLLLYEWCFGQKREGRWACLIPFFLMSMLFGLQPLVGPAGPETAYSMHLTPITLLNGVVYYGGKLLYAPLAGVAVSIGLLFLRQRAITLGVIGFWIMLFPMLLFPGRQFGAYLYVPLLAFAIAIAGIAEWKSAWAAVFLLIWLPATYEELRIERRPILAFGHEHRPYVTQVLAALRAHSTASAVVFDGTPVDFAIWGQEGLFTYALDRYNLIVRSSGARDALETMRRPDSLLLTWDLARHKLLTEVYPGDGRELSYVDFSQADPFWQMKRGWKDLADGCRWMDPQAVITLRKPQTKSVFELRANAQAGQLIRVSSAGDAIGEYRFTRNGPQTVTWSVSPSPAALTDVAIAVDPPFRLSAGSVPLGVMICSCGFLTH